MIELVKYKHVGLTGLPGAGKDFIYNYLYRVNQKFELNFGEKRPFHNVKRLSLADRLRELTAWITDEDYKLYLHHPFKDENVVFNDHELNLSRRDFMIKLGKFIEKNISEEWVLERTKMDLDRFLRDIVASAQWQVDINDDPEKGLIAELDKIGLNLFITTDVRQENQYDWIADNPNGMVIRVHNRDLKKRKLNKIEKLLDSKEVDLEIDVNDYILSQEDGNYVPRYERFRQLLLIINNFRK